MTVRQDNPRWPLEPPCACGAHPHGIATSCAHGHEDPADCRAWQDTATACGWLAPKDGPP